MELDGATLLLQWATGGMAFTWVTTRRRELGAGYGWLMRSIYGVLGALAVVVGRLFTPDGWGAVLRDTAGGVLAALVVVALGVSIRRRKGSPPFPPLLDALPAVAGAIGLVGAASASGGDFGLALARVVVGAAFLGVVTDAMLLGHWYLVQPGLSRAPLYELNYWLMALWPLEVGVFLWSPGMPQVFTGTIDDGWGGLLGWVWAVSAVTTLALASVVRLALKERYYSAVMSATGLLYLAILTGFGMDLVARATLAP